MWGYTKVNDTWKECVKCAAIVRNTDKHSDWHRFHGDETPLFELGLPTRVDNALRRGGILSIEGLIAALEEEARIWKGGAAGWLYDFRNVGFKGAQAAAAVLEQHGIVDTSGQLIKD